MKSVVTRLIGKTNPDDCATFEGDLKVCATDIDSTVKQNLLTPFGMTLSGYVWDDTYPRLLNVGPPTLVKLLAA